MCVTCVYDILCQWENKYKRIIDHITSHISPSHIYIFQPAETYLDPWDSKRMALDWPGWRLSFDKRHDWAGCFRE